MTNTAGTDWLYKVIDQDDWVKAQAHPDYSGSADDRRDGFVHLSASHQLEGTLTQHFASRANLVLIAFPVDRLGQALRWEASRGGELFPHLHGPLPVAAAVRQWLIPLGPNGRHLLPELPGPEASTA
jgi:uncharacterized protein (DUF952 family)